MLLTSKSNASARRSARRAPRRPVTRGRALGAVAALLAAIGLVAASGCDKSTTAEDTAGTGTGGEGGESVTNDPEEYFLNFVFTELDNSCGVCHQSDDGCVPRFMGESAESTYAAMKAYEGIVTHGDNSNLIYHGAHTGPALTEFQEELVREWLDREFADDDDPPKPTLGEALVEVGNCMLQGEFEDPDGSGTMPGVYLLAYQQSDQGPCGSCHRTGEAGTWIGYNEEEMFAKNTRLPWIKRLVKPAYDENNRFVDLVPSNRFVDKVESANACGSPHAAASVPVEMEASIEEFVQSALDRWHNGTCM